MISCITARFIIIHIIHPLSGERVFMANHMLHLLGNVPMSIFQCLSLHSKSVLKGSCVRLASTKSALCFYSVL